VLAVVGDLLNTLDVVRPRESISIHRTVDDLQTPEVVEEKSVPLVDPRAEPRPVRGVERGEPPVDALDMAPLIEGYVRVPDVGAALPVEPATGMGDVPAVADVLSDPDATVAVTDSGRRTPSVARAERGRKSFSAGGDAGEVPVYENWGEFVGALFGRRSAGD
jgi:hypothetical protein